MSPQDKTDICPEYKPEMVVLGNKQVESCSYYNLSNNGECYHDSHNVCVFYLIKNGVRNKVAQKFFDENNLRLEKDCK